MSGWDQNDRDRERKPAGDGAAIEEPDAAEQHHALRTNVAKHKRWIGRKAQPGEEAVQAKGEVDAEGAQEHAASGLADAGAKLPHLDKIQKSFGGHDVSGVKAAVGGRAAQANEAMGSTAYTRGDAVAFKGAPDLHTAAHEAAHAVQQRAGVSVAGGVGKAGDRYERHADEVAERVVAGKSAKPILDKLAGGARSSGGAVQHKAAPIQFLGGNIEKATVGPGINPRAPAGPGGARPTVAAELGARDQAGGRPGQAGAVTRDANHNNVRKVAFEAELANSILANPATYQAPIHNVSSKILKYVDTKVGNELGKATAKADQELDRLAGGPQYFGRVLAEAGKTFAQTIRGVLAGGGSIPNHLMAHSMFMTQIYEKDFADQIAQKLVAVGNKPKYLKEKDTKVALGGGGAVTPFASAGERGRQAPGQGDSPYHDQPGHAAGDQVPQVHGASGIADRPREAGAGGGAPGRPAAGGQPRPVGGEHAPAPGADQSHERGVDRWTADEQNAFVQDARLVLDMPVSGAGVSGSTSELLNCALILGTPKGPELMEYALGVMGYLGGGGAHSFHEIMSIAAAAGLPYVPGQYKSMLPASFVKSPAFLALHDKFKDVLDADPAAPPAASGPAVASAAAPGGPPSGNQPH